MKRYILILSAILTFILAGCEANEGMDSSADTNGSEKVVEDTRDPQEDIEDTSDIQVDTEDTSDIQVDTEDTSEPESNIDENAENQLSTEDASIVEEVSAPIEDSTEALGEGKVFSNDEEILITQSGTYEFSGDYIENTITVNVDKEADDGIVYLVLSGANITSDRGTPISIIEAQDVVIVLKGENTVTQGAITTTDTEFPSAAIYSKADTAITGEGSLTVNTLYMDGIDSRDDLIIEDAQITVNAVEHGIEGKDLLTIENASINVTSGRDGIRTSNDEDLEKGNLIITSGDIVVNALHDGIAAEQTLQIDGGSFDITTGGGFVEVLNEITRGEGSGNTISATDLLEDSMRSLKGTNITINGGEFILNSYEDTVHANGVLTINSGYFDILSGDDALHADTDLIINNIDVTVQNGYEGIEGETVTINGGDMSVTVLDDAVNANSDAGFVKIAGGNIYLKCSGDGIDSNGDLIIEGGDIVLDVDAVYSGGDGYLDVTGTYSMTGGSITDENGNAVSLNTNAMGAGTQPNSRPGGTMPGGSMPGGSMPGGTMPGGNRPRG